MPAILLIDANHTKTAHHAAPLQSSSPAQAGQPIFASQAAPAAAPVAAPAPPSPAPGGRPTLRNKGSWLPDFEADAAPGEGPSVQGRVCRETWMSGKQGYVWTFEPGGVLVYGPKGTDFRNGSWRQRGGLLFVETNDHYAERLLRWNGKCFDGPMQNVAGLRTDSQFTLVEA